MNVGGLFDASLARAGIEVEFHVDYGLRLLHHCDHPFEHGLGSYDSSGRLVVLLAELVHSLGSVSDLVRDPLKI